MHGMASADSAWNGVCARLSGVAPVWSADLPWRGEGVCRWAYHRDSAVWVRRALDELGGADVVVAHSFAATLLLDLLTRGPADSQLGRYGIKGLVLVAPFYRPRPEDFDWDAMSGLVERFQSIMEEGVRVAAAGRGKPDLHRPLALRLCQAIGPYGWARVYDVYLRTPWMAVHRITVPTLVVRGVDDAAAPPGESEALAAALPAGRLHRIAGSGHHPMIERPEEFARLLRTFLDEMPVRVDLEPNDD